MAENLMEPTESTGMSPDAVDRILKYLSGKMSGLIPETSEDVAARRKDIGDGLGRAYDSVMNPLNAAGRLMRAPVAAGMRAVGIDAQSPYAPTAQAVQTNMNSKPPGFVDMQSEAGAGTPLTGALGNIGRKNTVRRPPAPGPAPLQTVMPVDEAMGPGGRYGGQSDVNAVMDDQPKPAVAAPAAVPAAPQKGLREDFMARLAGMNKGQSTGMTQEQKGRALMEAGLAIMAASKPGVSALSAIGQGGMQGTAVAREMERINRQQADKLRAEQQGNLRTEFTLAGQDEARADRRTDRAEGHAVRREDIARQEARDSATDTRENRRIDLLQKQIDAGKVQVIENGKTGTFTILNTTTGETKDTGVKVKAKDDTPAEVKLLQALRRDPKLLETYKEIKGEKGGISDKDVLAQAVEFAKPQLGIGGTENPEAVLQRSVDSMRRAAGRPGAPQSRDAQAAAVREQFRQKQITKEQAVQQLQKLGYQ